MGGIQAEVVLPYVTRHGRALTGTLYRPEAKTRAAALVAVHGGAWRQGSADRYRYWGPWLAARGLAIFAINYRLLGPAEHGFPAALDDVRAAIRFLHGRATDLGLDPHRLGAMGDSAGGHLVALAALDREDPDPALKAVVGVYGVYDLLAQWEHDLVARPRDSITEALLRVSAIDDRMAYHRASPITYAVAPARDTRFLVAWGTDDDIVDGESQSRRFADALRRAGYYVRTAPVRGAGHFWIDEPLHETGSHAAYLAPRLAAFLKEAL